MRYERRTDDVPKEWMSILNHGVVRDPRGLLRAFAQILLEMKQGKEMPAECVCKICKDSQFLCFSHGLHGRKKTRLNVCGSWSKRSIVLQYILQLRLS